MIESLQIADVATYSSAPEVLGGLSEFNFIFGSNGTGKTTIGRVIADEEAFEACNVTWKGGTKLQPMVHNSDFVATNFDQSAELKGVFTLGKRNVDAVKKIAAAKNELDALTKGIEALTLNLQGEDGEGGKKGDLVALEEWLKNRCWEQKQKHDAKLSGAFEGLRGSLEKFKTKILHERATNSAELESLADLEKRAETVFGPTPGGISSRLPQRLPLPQGYLMSRS